LVGCRDEPIVSGSYGSVSPGRVNDVELAFFGGRSRKTGVRAGWALVVALVVVACGSSPVKPDDDDGWIDDGDDNWTRDGGGASTDAGGDDQDGSTSPASDGGGDAPVWLDGTVHCAESECAEELRTRLSFNGTCEGIEGDFELYNCGEAPLGTDVPVTVYYSPTIDPAEAPYDLEEVLADLGPIPAGLPPDRFYRMPFELPGALWNGRIGRLVFVIQPPEHDCDPLNEMADFEIPECDP